jgi:hypothetical protein
MGNMSTKKHSSLLDAALANVPKAFRGRIISAYLDLKRNHLEARHDAAGLSAGRFCEIVLRHLQERSTGTHISFGTKIGNFADECRKLITSPAGSSTESERVVIPRALVFLYTMRNKRGIGHVGGDVDANQIDSTVITKVADWILCELIRIHHGMSLEEAQDLVDSISVREVPAIWEIAGKKRVLKGGVKAKDQVLLLLYSSTGTAVLVEDLCDWVEYSNLGVFKSRVVRDLHKQRLVEHDKDTETVFLSPKGTQFVEDNLL